MRLIDADDFLQNLIHYKIGRQSLEEVIKAVNAQPIAYNVDAVAEQLEELTGEECTLHECGIRSERCKLCIAKKAIEIVKGSEADA